MAKNKAIIFGSHPLVENLLLQYRQRDFDVTQQPLSAVGHAEVADVKEIVVFSEGDDHAAVAQLLSLVHEMDNCGRRGEKLLCHLLLQSAPTLQMMQTCDFCDVIRRSIDIHPFTMDEEWIRTIVLDYEPITIQSEKHVHLVIFGMNEIAEMVAIHAALKAHFPNYVKNHLLRTRITMVDVRAESLCQPFIKRYRNLFDNSYYRIIKPSEEKAVVRFHKPMYEDCREDFVDVEWEFVEAESWNAELREKLQRWAQDEGQLLTIVMADKDQNKNLNEALHLPQELFTRHTHIYIYCHNEISQLACPNIHCFGMEDRGYDLTLPLVRMAKNVKYIYDCCYHENFKEQNEQLFYPVDIDPEQRERLWAEESSVKRMSSICNAMTIPVKMRSVGLKEDEWEKFYDIPQHDIEMLAQVEHNRWCVEELILGYRPCTDEEQEKIADDIGTQKQAFKKRKIHYDLRAYDDLRPDETGKPVQIYDLCLCACLPLIAKNFVDEDLPPRHSPARDKEVTNE